MYGIDQFNVSRLAQLFLALDDPYSIRFDLPVEDKNRIRTAITDILRAKSIAVLRSELTHTSDEFLDICYQLSGKKRCKKKKAVDPTQSEPKRKHRVINEWDVPFVENDQLRDILLARAPHRPYCGDDLSWTSPRDLDVAMSRRYLQLNPPGFSNFLTIDVDHAGAANAWKGANLPPPTWVAINPENGHAHLVYVIKPRIWRNGNNQKPARYFDNVAEAYRVALQGDINYVGLLTKNPVHPDWLVKSECDYRMYELGELAEHVDLVNVVPKKKAKEKVEAKVDVIGRNCILFDTARVWAYSAVKNYSDRISFFAAVLDHIEELNAVLLDPLPSKETRHIAKSITRWTWKHMREGRGKTSFELSKRQSALGRRSGEVRRKKSGRLTAAMRNSVSEFLKRKLTVAKG